MTVPSTTPYLSYTCTGGNDFDFTFKCYEGDHLQVTRIDTNSVSTILTLDTDYTVTLSSDYTGYITLTSTYTDGTIVLRRIVPVKQDTNWVNNDPLDAETLEMSHDLLVMMMQQINVDVNEAGALLDAASYATAAEQYMLNAEDAQDAAERAEADAEAAAAGVSLPAIAGGDADKILQVKDDESGYELVAYPTVPDAVPTGTLMMWASASVPTGFLECDGSALSQTTYSDLYAVLGGIYGSDASNFNLPDMRGRFPRGWDHGVGLDPDAADRTDRGDATAGDNIGTKQADANDSHYHSANPPSANSSTTGSHIHSIVPFYKTGKQVQSGGGDWVIGTGQLPQNTVSGGNHSHSTNIGSFNTGSQGEDEARPVNINVMFIIKY